MCGIAGYSGKGNETTLESMNISLKHRGPDDAGLKVFQKKYTSIGIAQRRLSIVDLSPAGHQPMANEKEDVWIVFNGEIYNHHELRKELKNKHTFIGKSDTEVIVHLYEEVGEEVFSKLEGMFAIALYDVKKDLLFLARDRMGKKPLYWSLQEGTLLFGSELKALMAHPSFVREVDLVSVNKYFQYEYVPTPYTIFKDTWKLEPATTLVWNGKTVRKSTFWKPTFLPKSTSFEDAKDELDTALTKAVASRLEADVPLGIFLSGGIDSSAVAYYATKTSKQKVKTFSIGFKEKSFDESTYARQVAEHLGTEHHEEILPVEDCLKLIPEIGEYLDEPVADSSIIPTYLLSRFTREHVTVALGGDGGDELFCGYDTFLAHRLAGLYEKVPSFIRKVLAKSVRMLPTSHSNMSLDFKLKKSTKDFEGNPDYRNQRWLGAYGVDDRRNLFNKEVWEAVGHKNVYEDIDRYLREADSRDTFDRLGLVYERMYMMDQVLVKVDRASMMHALEVRAPFLDTLVVDLANHMPWNFKLRRTERKYILKKLMEGKLPREIIYRKKKGFGIPIGAWMKGEMRPMLEEHLGRDSLDTIGIFNTEYVSKLLADHVEGKCDNRKQLWTLLVFVLWWKRWMGKTVR